MRYFALSFVLGSFLIGGAAHACEPGDKVCADQKFLALGGDPRETAEMDLANQRFRQAIHCPPNDATHPGRCDGTAFGSDEARNFNDAWKRLTDEQHAAHLHACQLGYALHGTCN